MRLSTTWSSAAWGNRRPLPQGSAPGPIRGSDSVLSLLRSELQRVPSCGRGARPPRRRRRLPPTVPTGSTAAGKVELGEKVPRCWRRRWRSSPRRAAPRRSPGPLSSPTCACARRWLSALTSAIEPISTDVCISSLLCKRSGFTPQARQLFGLQVQVRSLIFG